MIQEMAEIRVTHKPTFLTDCHVFRPDTKSGDNDVILDHAVRILVDDEE